MTDKEFMPWLKGFLTGKSVLNIENTKILKETLKLVVEERTTTRKRYDEPIPTYVPTPIGPMNPTCDSGKRLIKDEVYGPGRDNYGRDNIISIWLEKFRCWTKLWCTPHQFGSNDDTNSIGFIPIPKPPTPPQDRKITLQG